MEDTTGTNSRKLLKRLRGTLAEDSAGQARLDKITHLIADSMGTEVCSIYLFRDKNTLELCATEGLHADAVHKTRLRLGEGLVGRVAARKSTMSMKLPDQRTFTVEERIDNLHHEHMGGGEHIVTLGKNISTYPIECLDLHVQRNEEY